MGDSRSSWYKPGDRSLNSNWSYLSLVCSEGREAVVLILHYQTKACFFRSSVILGRNSFLYSKWDFRIHQRIHHNILADFVTFLVSSPIDKLSGRLRKLQLIRNTPKCDFCCFSIAWWLNMDGLQFINGVLLVLLISALLAKGKLIINILSASNRIKGDLSLSRPLTAIRTSQRKKEKNTLRRLFIKEYIRGIMELLSFRLIYHNAIMLNIEYL